MAAQVQNRQSRKLNSSFRALHVNIYAGIIITGYISTKLDFSSKIFQTQKKRFNSEVIFYTVVLLVLPFSVQRTCLANQELFCIENSLRK